MAAIVVIPARYGSTRFPAKILASETGRPLVQHAVEQVARCTRVGRTIVATDDERIVAALRPFGTTCLMTDPGHQSGTDRVAEVARGLDLTDRDVIVNVQGDEPEIDPDVIDGLIDKLDRDDTFDMATAATPFPVGADPCDPNLVKVVTGAGGRAVYFSRSPVPYPRETSGAGGTYNLHLGVYAYRRDFLLRFAGWAPTPLEQTEKLEQLRAIEHGRSIYVMTARRATHGIDTPGQYAEFVKRHLSKGVAGG